MNTYLNQETIDIERQTLAGGKTSYSTSATGVPAYVRPLTEEEANVNGLQSGKGLFMLVKDSVDIQDGDRVIFNTLTHLVSGVARHTRGISLPKFKQVIMTEPLKT